MPGSGLAHMGTTGWGEDRPDTSGAWGHETRDTAGMSSQTLKEAQQEAIRDQVCSNCSTLYGSKWYLMQVSSFILLWKQLKLVDYIRFSTTSFLIWFIEGCRLGCPAQCHPAPEKHGGADWNRDCSTEWDHWWYRWGGISILCACRFPEAVTSFGINMTALHISDNRFSFFLFSKTM